MPNQMKFFPCGLNIRGGLPQTLWVALFITLCIGLEACNYSRPRASYKPGQSRSQNSAWKQQVKKANVWEQKNPKIRKYIRVYSAKRNRTIELALKRAQPYLPFIQKELKRRRLPQELALLPILESSFNPRARSRTGATGMWQFTTATAKDYGLHVGLITDERLNWRKSTRAAITYLDKLNKKFNGNWELALAAYNGGPGYISRSMKKQHTWNFWDLKLRDEPQEYVPKFLAMIQVAKLKYAHLYQA